MKNCFYLLITLLFVMTSCQTKRKLETYTIETSMGNIKVKLYDKTPLHKANFEQKVKEQVYDSVLFHRVIKDFMIQGGDPNTKPLHLKNKPQTEKAEETIPAEFEREYYHKKGALAAARIGDAANPEKRSSPTQFYIVQGRTFSDEELRNIEESYGIVFTDEEKETYKSLGGTPFLDRNYTVFGEVVEGLGVVNQIAEVATNRSDKPLKDLYIVRITKD